MNRSKYIMALLFISLGLSPIQLNADNFVDPVFATSSIEDGAVISNLTAISQVGGRLIAVGERGHVLVSDSNGHIWTQANVPTQRLLTAVDFVDDKNGWAVGHDHLILHTNNSGANWVVQNENIASDLPAPLLNVGFFDSKRGLAIGAYGAAYMTTDGGISWFSIKDNLDNEDEWHNYGLAISQAGSAYVCGESGTFYRSNDGGIKWDKLTVPFEGTLFGVLALTEGQVIAYGVAGKVLYSSDQGESWLPIDSGTKASFYGADNVSDDLIVLVGSDGVISSLSISQMEITTINRDDRKTLSDVVAVGHGIGLVGMAGYKFVD